MSHSAETLCQLNERIQAVSDVLVENSEYAVAGLHFKRSSYKHPKYCKTSYYVVTNVITNETILELQTYSNHIDLSKYCQQKHHWQRFIDICRVYKSMGNSLQSICF